MEPSTISSFSVDPITVLLTLGVLLSMSALIYFVVRAFRRADIEKTPKLTAQNSGATTSTGADGGTVYPVFYTGTTDAGSSSDGGSGDSGGGGDGGGGGGGGD